MTDEEKLITICDNRFEIISKAKKHIIEATNIEMSPKEMEVLDNFLFRCWQMGWLKNDYKALEIENAKLKAENQIILEDHDTLSKWVDELREQIENLKMVASSWIMSLMDVKESKVNDRRGEVLKEIERRMEKLAK